MHEPDVPTKAQGLIELVASAIRDELGEEIDAYPGLRNPEGAHVMNRAFRDVVRALDFGTASQVAAARSVSDALRLAAERRLLSEGWDNRQSRHLIEQQPGSPDDWLAFLLLSSRQQIQPLLAHDEPGNA